MLGWNRHASDLFCKNPSYFYIAQRQLIKYRLWSFVKCRSFLDQLKKLFDLKQKGILSEEEYLAQKAKLLG